LRDALWDKAERLLIGLLGALAMLIGLVQVVGRYVAPRYAISWAEEVIVYLSYGASCWRPPNWYVPTVMCVPTSCSEPFPLASSDGWK
jgi:hypothetical protein